MSTVKVEVTFDDVAKGERGDCRYCPIALALERVLTERALFVVDGRTISWAGPTVGAHGYVDLPESAREFIYVFDGAGDVEPFEFEIELPDKLLAVTP